MTKDEAQRRRWTFCEAVNVGGMPLKTVQMTLGEDLVSEVDRIAKELGTTRSEFTRHALQEAITRLQENEMEQRHKEGYMRKPIKPGEFSDWENEQVWGE